MTTARLRFDSIAAFLRLCSANSASNSRNSFVNSRNSCKDLLAAALRFSSANLAYNLHNSCLSFSLFIVYELRKNNFKLARFLF